MIVYADSMPRRIDFREFNRHTPDYHTYFKCFRGANSQSVNHYVDEPDSNVYDVATIHVGTNDLAPRNKNHPLTDEQIVAIIEETGKKFRSRNIKDIIISSIITRKDHVEDRRRQSVNRLLKEMCLRKNFHYLDNANITRDLLYKDGIHLSDKGEEVFANNIDFLNNIDTN